MFPICFFVLFCRFCFLAENFLIIVYLWLFLCVCMFVCVVWKRFRSGWHSVIRIKILFFFVSFKFKIQWLLWRWLWTIHKYGNTIIMVIYWQSNSILIFTANFSILKKQQQKKWWWKRKTQLSKYIYFLLLDHHRKIDKQNR